MRSAPFLVFSVVSAILSACSSQKTLQATSGSRADGVVNLSYQVGMFEKPVIEWDQALATARKRCNAWGFADAERFGGSTPNCQRYNAYGNCLNAIVTVAYQCLD